MDETPHGKSNPCQFRWSQHDGSADVFILSPILQDHVTKKYSNIMGRNLWMLVTILPNLVSIRTVVVDILMTLLCHMISQDHVIKE